MRLEIGDVVKVGEKFGTIEGYRVGSEGKTYEYQVTGDNLVDIKEEDIDSKWVRWQAKKKKVASDRVENMGGE